jgi:amino-acid N-acetyltransferase
MVTTRTARPQEHPAFDDLVRGAGLPLDGLDSVPHRLVAEESGSMVGVAALERHGDGAGTAFLLRSVVTRPDRRGLGVGAALTRAALAIVDEAAAPVALLTETADAYFPRFGFHEVQRGELPPALSASEELRGACAVSARALLREVRRQAPTPPVVTTA